MNAPFKQDARLGRLSTALGKDFLVLMRFDGTDAVNDLFEYRVDALSTAPNVDFDGLIGTHATVEIESQNDGTRVYDGIVTEAKWAGVGENGNKYAMTLRPWVWVASQRRNQRIFHKMTAVKIIEELLAPYSGLGEPASLLKLSGSYPELEYTVQYRESDWDFATRLMERFGISYHFMHDVGSHTLVLTDTIEAHNAVPGGSREYKPVEGARQANKEHFWEWHPGRRMTTGAMRLMDYNFKTPLAAMEVDRTSDAAYANGQTESYDYPGDYLDEGEGKDVVALRTLQERGQDARHHAIGDCTSLGAGMTLSLTGDQVNGVKGADYLCLIANHSYVSDAYGSGGSQSDGHAYSGAYTFIPTTAPLAPERKTRIPVVHGPQTAVVVGEGEIDCDEYGRILVHFHWDLEKAYSMRCRVSQNWASQGWGGMVIPRIGMEVVVEFLEGDPDKPLVTGCVYNGKNDPPYALPEHKTKSVFRTDSHKSAGFNELTFEDATGAEKIYMHGQKDHEIHIENDRTKRIDRNQFESVGRNKTVEIGNNHHEVIGGNMTLMVGPNKLQQAVLGKFKALTSGLGDIASKLGLPSMLNMGEGNMIIGVAKNKAETVMLSSTEVVGAGKATTVGGGFQTIVGGIKNTTVGIGDYEEVGQNKALVVGKQYEIVVGDSKVVMEENGTISITGKKILIDGQDLVRITGKSVKIN